MRGTGRTRAMVEQLPETGSVVIVHNAGLEGYVRRMIFDLRGPDVEKATVVRAVFSTVGAERLLLGRRIPVFVDHAFWYLASQPVADIIRELSAACRPPDCELTDGRARA